MKQAFSCGAVVFTVENGVRKYLLVTENSGHTGLPKGTMEPGETETQTALREIREETGIAPQLMDGFCHRICYQPLPDVEKHVTFFLARYDHQPIQPMENQVKNVLLLPFEQALCALTHQNTREVLQLAHTYLDAIDR